MQTPTGPSSTKGKGPTEGHSLGVWGALIHGAKKTKQPLLVMGLDYELVETSKVLIMVQRSHKARGLGGPLTSLRSPHASTARA